MRLAAGPGRRLRRQCHLKKILVILLISLVMPAVSAATHNLRNPRRSARFRLPPSVELEQEGPHSSQLFSSRNDDQDDVKIVPVWNRYDEQMLNWKRSDQAAGEDSSATSDGNTRSLGSDPPDEDNDGKTSNEKDAEALDSSSSQGEEKVSHGGDKKLDDHKYRLSSDGDNLCGIPLDSNFQGDENNLGERKSSGGFQDRIVGGGPATLSQNGFMVLFTLKKSASSKASNRRSVDENDDLGDSDGHWDSTGKAQTFDHEEDLTSPRATDEEQDADDAETLQPSADAADEVSDYSDASRPAMGFSSSSADEAKGSSSKVASVWCGGVLISRRLVLTAAHCFANGNVPSEMDIHIGIDHQAAAAGVLLDKSTKYSKPTQNQQILYDDGQRNTDLNNYYDYQQESTGEGADYDESHQQERRSLEESSMAKKKFAIPGRNSTRRSSWKMSTDEHEFVNREKLPERGKQRRESIQEISALSSPYSSKYDEALLKRLEDELQMDAKDGVGSLSRVKTKGSNRKRRYVTDDSDSNKDDLRASDLDYEDDAAGENYTSATSPEASSSGAPASLADSSSSGKLPLKADELASEYLFTAQDWILHTEFEPDTFHADLAIVLLERPVPFSEQTWPVCFPPPDLATLLQSPGKRTTAVGWGLTRDDNLESSSKLSAFKKSVLHDAEGLQSVDLSVLSSQDCESLFHGAGLSTVRVHDSQLCAYTDKEYVDRGPCQGDSGGPLVTTVGKKAVLLGIISAGTGCEVATEEEKSLPMPALYVKVSEFLPWIFDTSSELLARNDLR